MEQPNDNNNSIWSSQNARLGSFLIASSFLVAAFIQLVTAKKEIIILVHAIAALGSFTAALYFFMNFFLAMPKGLARYIRGAQSTGEQVVHTWLVPLFFLIFWMVTWIVVTDFWWAIAIVGLFILFCLWYQTHRYPKSKKIIFY